MRNALERIFDRVRIRIHRIDAPLVARAMMSSEADTIDRRITQVDIRRAHVDLRAQYHAAFRVLAVAHLAEQLQVFLG